MIRLTVDKQLNRFLLQDSVRGSDPARHEHFPFAPIQHLSRVATCRIITLPQRGKGCLVQHTNIASAVNHITVPRITAFGI